MGFLCALLILALHVWPGMVAPAHAQGSRKDDIVFNSRGIPLAGATVRICAMPATGQPCTPLAQIYADPGLTQALANPTTTDGLGNYFFYAAPGKYEIEVSGPGITTKQLPNVILPNDPSSPTFSSVSSTGAISAFSLNLAGNLTVNGNTTVLGNLASGTLNLTNQATPPGAAGSGTVNLYTKTADKKLYYKDDTGAEQGPLGAGAQTNASNTFTAAQNFDADIRVKGPNPWFDLSRYGGYSVNGTPPSTTGTISSSSTMLTLASAQDFANGQGIVVYQAGPATTLTHPGTPTVTSTNLTGGSTNYSYQVVAEDRSGGLTAASSAGSTSTGVATLGANTVSLTSCVRTNGVSTYTSSANHNLQVGTQIGITGFNSGLFTLCNGVKTIASTPTGTTFTTNDAPTNAIQYNETNTASATGTVIACNTLSFLNGSYSGQNTLRYWIYRSVNSGAYSIVGVAVGLDPWFQDCGAPAPSIPSYVPNTPPSTPQNEYLATTIASGGGTTTLTLTTAASNTVTAQTVLHDNSANLKNAITAASNAGGGTVYIPNGNGAGWPFNSAMDTNGTFSNSVRIHINGSVNLTQPWILKGGLDLEGEPHAVTSFQYVNSSTIGGSANPLLLWTAESGSGLHLKQLLLQASGNQQVALLSDEAGDGGGNVGLIAEDVNVNTGAYGPGVLLKGGFDYFFDRGTCFSNNGGSFTGGSCLRMTNSSSAVTLTSPAQFSGNIRINQWFMSGNAVQIDCMPNSNAFASSIYEIRNELFESSAAPFLRVNCPTDTFGAWNFFNIDTADVVVGIGTPLIDARVQQMGEVFCDGCQAGTSGTPFLISSNGMNDAVVLLNTNYGDPGNTTYTYQDFGVNTSGSAIANVLEYPMAPPGAPSVTVTAGTNWAIGTFPIQVQFLDVNGNASALSQAVTVTTTTGNQNINITEPTPPTGAVSWLPYINGGRVNIIPFGGNCNNAPAAVGVPLSTTTVSPTGGCGNSAMSATAGVSAITANGLNSTALTFVDPNKSGFTVQTNFPKALTANRTLSMPDVSGYNEVSSYLNSAYDNFNRANGAIGSNWTVTQNGLNVASNVIQGTTSGNHNTAYWSAAGASLFSPAQFAQATITALNTTNDFPGVTVLWSGTGGTTQGYMCIENSTNIYIQKMTAGVGSVLTSTTSTGAIGDVLRLEAAPGGVLTCYKNGVSTLTTTDTSYTTGSPGIDIYGAVAAEKNWSGGNLHAFAHLDLEQDWTKTQHLNGGITVGPTNGVTISQMQHQRSTTGIAATTRVEILLTWPIPFADSSYTATCSVEDSTTAAGSQGLVYERIRTKSASQIGAVVNNPTGGSITATVDCIGMHQ